MARGEYEQAITYGRRYSLAAIVGIAPEDDDAEAAVSHEQEKPKRSPRQSKDEMVPYTALENVYNYFLSVEDDSEWEGFRNKFAIERGKPFKKSLLHSMRLEIDKIANRRQDNG